MSSKSRRILLYVMIATMAVTQLAFAKDSRIDTLDESVEMSDAIPVLTEEYSVVDTYSGIELEESKVVEVAASAVATASVISASEITESSDTGILLGSEEEQEESDYKDMIVSYADPYLPVRNEANRDSTTVGKLYPGSYAEIVERGDEWTKIKSGKVEGYIQNIYVCFDDEAEDLANQLSGTLSTAITLAEEKEQQAKLAAAKAAAASKTSTGSTSANVSASDVVLLAAIIDWEANAEPYEGKLAVGYVIINRINASYGSSVTAVLTARGQFGGVSNGAGGFSDKFSARIAKYQSGTSNDCLRAAQEVINGTSNPLNDVYLNFNTTVSSASSWQQIGNHIFYNR